MCPYARRGRRFDEYIEAIRTAWRESPATYRGEFVAFEDVVLKPAPLTPGGPPMFVGGSSEAAFRRAARLGDGWFSHWTAASDPQADLAALQAARVAIGREGDEAFRIKVSLVHSTGPDELPARLDLVRSLGVAEVVLIVPVRTRTLEADLELWSRAAGLTSGATAPG